MNGPSAGEGGFMRAASDDFIASHAADYWERAADEIEPLPPESSSGGGS